MSFGIPTNLIELTWAFTVTTIIILCAYAILKITGIWDRLKECK